MPQWRFSMGMNRDQHVVRDILNRSRCVSRTWDSVRFDFDTWLMQNYGLKRKALTGEELAIARREYDEEYPREGERPIGVKTYPFKKYLDSKR